MGTVKHKLFGMAQIIRRDGDRITIKYDSKVDDRAKKILRPEKGI